jgi:hypothetical protein
MTVGEQMIIPGTLMPIVATSDIGVLTADRAGWQRAVLRAELPRATKLIALALASHALEGPSPVAAASADGLAVVPADGPTCAICAPGLTTLADETGYSATHVQRQIRILRERGWLVVIGRPAARRPARFSLSLPADQRAGLLAAEPRGRSSIVRSAVDRDSAGASADPGSRRPTRTSDRPSAAARRRARLTGSAMVKALAVNGNASVVSMLARTTAGAGLGVARPTSTGVASAPAASAAPSTMTPPAPEPVDEPSPAGPASPNPEPPEPPEPPAPPERTPPPGRPAPTPPPARPVPSPSPSRPVPSPPPGRSMPSSSARSKPVGLRASTVGATVGASTAGASTAASAAASTATGKITTGHREAANQVLATLARALRCSSEDLAGSVDRLGVILDQAQWTAAEIAMHLIDTIGPGGAARTDNPADQIARRLEHLPISSASCLCRACRSWLPARTGPPSAPPPAPAVTAPAGPRLVPPAGAAVPSGPDPDGAAAVTALPDLEAITRAAAAGAAQAREQRRGATA